MEEKRGTKANIIVAVICILIVALCVGAYFYFTQKHDKDIEQKNIEETGAIFTYEEYPKMDCSTVMIPLSKKFLADFTKQDETKVEVQSTMTDGAYANLVKKNVDAILVVEPSEGDKKIAEEAGVELTSYKIANEGFVFFANTANKVDNLTLEQIQKIYAGEITNWKEVGGDDQKIIAYQRPDNSGSQTGMYNLVMKGLKIAKAPTENIAVSMSDIIDLVSDYQNNPGSIGYSYYYYASSMYGNDELKLLSVDGVKPTNETIQNETYPIMSAYYVVIRKEDENNEKIKKLVNAMLSDRGQKLVKEAGYVSIK